MTALQLTRWGVTAPGCVELKWHLAAGGVPLCGRPTIGRRHQLPYGRRPQAEDEGLVCRICLHKEKTS